MKNLNTYITEKLKNNKLSVNYQPKTRDELKELVNKLIKERGNEADLNDIDTSEITDMSDVFYELDFNGDISQWDVSNVTDMSFMFSSCKSFNQDISNWDVSKVIHTGFMFERCAIDEKYKPKFK